MVKLAFVDRERDEEIAPVGGQFRHCRNHAEIGITTLQIEAPQLLAVEGQTIRVVIVVGGEEFPPRAGGRCNLLAQIGVGKNPIADEVDRGNAGGGTFVDLEHQVDAALFQPDDLGFDDGVIAAAPAIDAEQALDVGLIPFRADDPFVQGINPKTDEEIERKASDSEPFSALAFKVMSDPFVGKLTYFRVYSGKLEKGGHVDVTLDQEGKVAFVFEEKKHEKPEKDAKETADAQEKS